jgi:hypothetical protein
LKGALAAGALGALGGGLRTWPAAAAAPQEFMSSALLRERQQALDDIGLRATGTSVHHQYADGLAARLESVGVRDVRTEPVPLRRWQPGEVALDVLEGTNAGPVRVAAYVPYSGQTPAAGIESPLALVAATPAPGSLAGKIALFDVAEIPLTHAAMDLADYGSPDHPDGYNPAKPYERPWVAGLEIARVLEMLRTAGAEAAIGVLDLPREAADGSYFPYDGVIRELPALYVDRDVGARLKEIALMRATVRLTLAAEVDDVTTPNVYGFIPGRSDELVILHSHHDGTNGLEDNGPEAILAMSQYLARLPRGQLPRTILVLFGTGHFAGQLRSLGTEAFIERHRDDLIARTAAAVTLEHLGALEWLPGPDGSFALTGVHEDGGFFASPYDAVIDPARAALGAARFKPDRVMRPFIPDQRSPNWTAWPADGAGFWILAGLPSANFIVGPTYLLNGGISTVDKTDFGLMRRQAIAFTELVLQLARTPLEELQRRRQPF